MSIYSMGKNGPISHHTDQRWYQVTTSRNIVCGCYNDDDNDDEDFSKYFKAIAEGSAMVLVVMRDG